MSRFVEVRGHVLENFLKSKGFARYVQGNEVVYKLPNTHDHRALVKVYTSLPANGSATRGCGEDAIRVCAVWESATKSFGICKAKRVFRVTSEQSVLDRLLERMKEAYTETNIWLKRNWDRRPE